MRWWNCCVSVLFFIGRQATGELFQFDVSSLRPDELCAQSDIWQTGGVPKANVTNAPAMAFCPFQTHIELKAGEDDSDDDSPKTGLIQKIEQIRNHSANRAVALHLQEDASLLDAAILAPIGWQVVEFLIQEISKPNLTSQFPAIGLANLFDLRFFDCHPGVRLHEADFSGMKNIRAIEFSGTPLQSIEMNTFTNLATLKTLVLANDLGYHRAKAPAFWRRLKCDAKNAWLWELLKGKPGLQKDRSTGEIFTLGNFTSDALKMDDERRVDCREKRSAFIS